MSKLIAKNKMSAFFTVSFSPVLGTLQLGVDRLSEDEPKSEMTSDNKILYQNSCLI